MASPILRTKLFFPPARPNRIARPRLVEMLQRGLRGALTLISAPAGSGKTTLLGEWRAGPGASLAAGWVSLDSTENDRSLFVRYLLAAVDTALPGIAPESQVSLHADEKFDPSVGLVGLLNSLGSIDQDLVLVLDDYHRIEAPDVHDTLNFILTHLPPWVHLVLLTRNDPPLPLARLRASGALVEIRAQDLRFNGDECASFLNQQMNLNLSREQVASMEKRTEGWIAGLQLAALSMQNRLDVGEFVAAFSGSHQYIVDYLTEEVLSRLPLPVQDFLLETSFLERMSADLCNTLTGMTDAQHTLELLEHANLFIIPLDENRTWYRYHNLFADQLQIRLQHQRPCELPDLLKRASDWCKQHGYIDEAIRYALKAGAVEQAAGMIELHIRDYLAQGRMQMIEHWFDALPGEIIYRRPQLALDIMWAIYSDYRFDRCEALLNQVEMNLPADQSPDYQGQLALWRGIFDRRHCRFEASESHLQYALTTLPAGEIVLRRRTWSFLGLIYLESDIHLALKAFQQALEITQGVIHPNIHQTILYHMAVAHILQGHLLEVDSIDRQARSIASHDSNWPINCYAHFITSILACEHNDLQTAAEHADRGLELARLAGYSDVILVASLIQAQVKRASGLLNEAQALLDLAAELARPTIPWMRVQVMCAQTSLFLARGLVEAAATWLDQNQIQPHLRTPVPWLQEQVLRASTQKGRLSAQQRLDQLGSLRAQAQAKDLDRLCIQIDCLRAAMEFQKGMPQTAINILKSAFALAEPQNSVQVFLDLGQPLTGLLRDARLAGFSSPFLDRLQAAFQQQAGEALTQHELRQSVLTAREMDLLKLIANGETNGAIARTLGIAIGTVKRHTVNIYTKLDVQNRTEAVARARQLGLL